MTQGEDVLAPSHDLHTKTPATEGILARAARRIRPRRKLRVTREGKYFVGITLGVGLAAINTGNNLLYLLLGLLLSLILVSGVMSELSLRQLTVNRRLPARAQAGRPHLVEIEVFNHKQKLPSYAIEVEDLRAGQPADKRCFFLKISPRSAQVAAYRRKPHRRGRDTHTGFRVATRFPFGVFEKSLHYELDGEMIIYPAIDRVRLPREDAAGDRGGVESLRRGCGDEIVGLRAMRPGDDHRDIYWRKSTVPNQFVLKERAREARPEAVLELDDIRPQQSGAEWNTDFERRIREVASHAVARIKRGDGVKIATASGRSAWANATAGADPILRFLALIEAVDEQMHATQLERKRDAVVSSGGLSVSQQLARAEGG